MIDFKTVYDETTKTKFFVASAKLADEKPNFSGSTMYRIDLIPYNEDDAPCLYNVPIAVERSGNNKTEYFIPALENAICSDVGCYDFDNISRNHLISATLNCSMLNVPHKDKKIEISGAIYRGRQGIQSL